MYDALLSSVPDFGSSNFDFSGLEGFIQPDGVNESHPILKFGLENMDTDNIKSKFLEYKTKMEDMSIGGQKESHLHVHTLDNRYYRIYISPNNMLDTNVFQNKICTFLDGLVEGQVLRLMFGASLNGWWNDISLGAIISSMRNCKAKIITSVIGRCGTAETYLWLFGQERTFSQYGEIQFTGVQKILKQFPVYKDYFDFIFSKAVALNILTEDQKTILMTTNSIIFWNKTQNLSE